MVNFNYSTFRCRGRIRVVEGFVAGGDRGGRGGDGEVVQ
jgi:hypothetical protein